MSEDAPTNDSIESQAADSGWVKKEDYKGDPNNWVDAGEFVRRGSLFRKIEEQNKKLQSVESLVKTMNESFSKAEERIRAETLAKLQSEKIMAENLNDLKKFKALEQQEAELVSPKEDPGVVVRNTNEFKSFKEGGNNWVDGKDPKSLDLQADARLLAMRFERDNPSASLHESFEYIHEKIRERNPDYFKSETKKEKGSPVAAGGLKKPASAEPAKDEFIQSLPRYKQDAIKALRVRGLNPDNLIKAYKLESKGK